MYILHKIHVEKIHFVLYTCTYKIRTVFLCVKKGKAYDSYILCSAYLQCRLISKMTQTHLNLTNLIFVL